jgi:hypothetical protein
MGKPTNDSRSGLLARWLPFDVYPLDEITSEKLRCVIHRVQCRDLYDLYRLTEDLKVELRELTELFQQSPREEYRPGAVPCAVRRASREVRGTLGARDG